MESYTKSFESCLSQAKLEFSGAISLKAKFASYNINTDENLVKLDDLFLYWDSLFVLCETKYTPHEIKISKNFPYATTIKNNIAILKLEYNKAKSASILLEISKLIKQLHQAISSYTNKRKSLIKKLRRIIKIKSVIDLRSFYRKMIRFLFKNMSDVSGYDNKQTFSTKSINCKSLNYYQNEKSHKLYKTEFPYSTKQCSEF